MPQRRSAPTRRVATKQPTSLSLPGGHELLLTRRHFLYGVAGVAALAAEGGAWAAGRSNDDDALKTLKVPEGAVTAQSSLEKMESYEDAVTLAGSAKLPFGTLDINLYRDDWTTMHARPTIGESNITTPLDNKNVILVDDVLFTGRTIRAALEAILDYGRPKTVELLVLVDRGHRELPIHGDYVGRKINTARTEKVNVLMEERDGRDEVVLESADA